MFRSLSPANRPMIMLDINGQPVIAPVGSTVWAAMALHADTITRRAAVSGEPRSAYCAMGVCFECLVEIDGQPDRQACLTEVREGMCVRRQSITEQSQAVAEGDRHAD